MAGSKWISNERIWFNRLLLTRVLALFYWIDYKLPTAAVFRQTFKYTTTCLPARQNLRSHTAWFAAHFFWFVLLSIMYGAEKMSRATKNTYSVERRNTPESKEKWFLGRHHPVWLPDCLQHSSVFQWDSNRQLSNNTACRFNHLKKKKPKALFYPVCPDFQKSIGVGKDPWLHPFVLLPRSTCR